VDGVTSDNGLIVSVSGPPIDTKRGYLHVLRFQGCDFWYGERRKVSLELQEFGDRYGESVLPIRSLDSEDLLALQYPAQIDALKRQAIPRAAIPNCTNHLSVVNTLRESGFDSACSIEGFQLFGGEFHIQTGEVILELRYLPRS
jgi:hypothetical protein